MEVAQQQTPGCSWSAVYFSGHRTKSLHCFNFFLRKREIIIYKQHAITQFFIFLQKKNKVIYIYTGLNPHIYVSILELNFPNVNTLDLLVYAERALNNQFSSIVLQKTLTSTTVCPWRDERRKRRSTVVSWIAVLFLLHSLRCAPWPGFQHIAGETNYVWTGSMLANCI